MTGGGHTGGAGGADQGGEPLGGATPTAERLELGEGLSLRLAEQLSLELEGRELIRLAGSPARALSYSERAVGPAGIWTFTRGGEERLRFSGERTHREAGEAGQLAQVTWRGETGSASLSFSAGPQPFTTRVELTVEGLEYQSLELAFACDERSSFYGFGEQYHAIEQRGERFELFVSEQGVGREGQPRALQGDKHTSYFPMPWWIDLTRGSGVLIETPYRTLVDLCVSDPDEARFEVTAQAPLSLLVFHGPSPLELIEQLSAVVGRPKRPPSWAFEAPWISAQGGGEAVRAFIQRLDEQEVPYAAIWSQDWTGVRVNVDGGLGVEYRWELDEAHYPNLNELISSLHERGKRFLAYANPFIDPELPNHFEELASRGGLITNPAGEPYTFLAPNGRSSHPDLSAEAGRDYVVEALSAMVSRHGIDGWMADFAEWTPLDARFASGEDPRAAHNLFPVWWHEANRAAMEATRPDGDWVLFARSGWTGVQAHSMIHWVGDQEATWSEHDGLPTVVPAMLNLGLAGVPYVTHDIGGFSGGPSTKELYMRWVELGAFTPIMRTHEGNKRDLNHNWDSDEETLTHFRRFARIHQALSEDWTQLADEANRSSAPIVRALALHYPEDPEARALSDQYLLGESLLVAPVVEEGATERRLYLPQGEWFHVFTGERYEGPSWLTVEAPIGSPPVFSRDRDRAELRAID